jgi:hypothetical protein
VDLNQEIMYQLGGIQSSLQNVVAHLKTLELQLERDRVDMKAEVVLLKERANKIEQKIMTHEARVYGIASVLALIIPFVITKLKTLFGF